MNHNELQRAEYVEHVLAWASYYKKSLVPYHTVANVLSDNPLPNILQSIDADFFVDLYCEFDYLKYFNKLESYLQSYVSKKIKRKLKMQLLTSQCGFGILCIALYLCVHCANKQHFIAHILQLSPGTQTCLMRLIEQIDENIENAMQIKQILEKVEELEMENDYLKEELKVETQKTSILNEKIRQMQNYYKSLEQETEAHRKEKADIIKQLNITLLNDYTQVFKALQHENNQMFKRLNYYQDKISRIQNEKLGFKAKIIEDSYNINELNEQLQRVKGICKNLRLSASFSGCDYDNTAQDTVAESHILKQNRSFFNMELSKSILMDHHSKKKLQYSEDDEILKLKYENKELLNKYETLLTSLDYQRATLEDYQRQNTKLRKDKHFLKQQMNSLKVIMTAMAKEVE